MKKIILMLLIVRCSAVPNPKDAFLQTIQGNWKTTEDAENWFTILVPPVVVPVNTPVSVAADGSFRIANVDFSFREITASNLIVIYSVAQGSTIMFAGVGIGQTDNILILNPVANVSSVQQVTTGRPFLVK